MQITGTLILLFFIEIIYHVRYQTIVYILIDTSSHLVQQYLIYCQYNVISIAAEKHEVCNEFHSEYLQLRLVPKDIYFILILAFIYRCVLLGCHPLCQTLHLLTRVPHLM